ncbi:MAG TPA: universal stress protein [Candidatus Binatia bacterium]|nr:universal stress protein [Candidatus Binatia bacterium]
MYTRMLVALDGSKLAENVLPYARTFAAALALRVELLNVVESLDFARTSHAGHARTLDSIIEAVRRDSKQYLERVAQSFSGVPVTSIVEQGEADKTIIERAAGDKETLIAMATRGRSGIHRWLMGSVAEKVLRGASNPLLLVRGNEEGKSDGAAALKSIVVPLDGSQLAERVLPHAIELAKKLRLEIVLTRAYQIPVSSVYVGAEAPYIANSDALLNMVREEAGAYLEAKVNELKQKGIEKVSSVLSVGSGADEIIELARSTPDNLIAMCTHGRSGVRRWALGSVTEKVVRHSGDPVLVVRAEE